MARPLSATDDEILSVAGAVFARGGATGFSVSQVARELGLSRAAITARFNSADDLKRLIAKRNIDLFEQRFADFRPARGVAGLVSIAERIGAMLGKPRDFASFLFRYTANLDDPILAEMEQRRGRILRRVIAEAMPKTALPRNVAVDLFMAQLTGSLMNWQASGKEKNAARFLSQRALMWAKLAGLEAPHEFR